MNVICGIDGKVCFRGCTVPSCKALEINPLATDVPKEGTPFRGIFPPFLEKLTQHVSAETNLSDELKVSINLPL